MTNRASFTFTVFGKAAAGSQRGSLVIDRPPPAKLRDESQPESWVWGNPKTVVWQWDGYDVQQPNRAQLRSDAIRKALSLYVNRVAAKQHPFSEYKKRPGDRIGSNWRMRNIQGRRAVRYVLFDSNHWKSFIYERLKVGMGGRGSLSLFGDNAGTHRLFAEHLTSEFRVRTSGPRT